MVHTWKSGDISGSLLFSFIFTWGLGSNLGPQACGGSAEDHCSLSPSLVLLCFPNCAGFTPC